MIGHYARTPEEVEALWPRIRPFIERAVLEAGRGEYSAQDVREMAVSGHATLFLVERGGIDCMGGALEFIRFPAGRSLNIMTIAGQHLDQCAAWFMDDLKRFAKLSDAKWIEATTSPAMARLLRRVGFETIYHTSRVPA